MGKYSTDKRKPIMADVVNERRKPSHNLKRSKSVRASLRFIGTKFLTNHKNSNGEAMQKAPSLSSLHDYNKNGFFHKETCHQYAIVPEYYIKEPVETILKTPVIRVEKTKPKKADKVKVSTPPATVAPKAAQILQIPVKEDRQPMGSVYEDVDIWPPKRNGSPYRDRTRFDAFDFDYRHNGFQRTTLRLSMMTRRRANARNSTFVEYQSRYSSHAG